MLLSYTLDVVICGPLHAQQKTGWYIKDNLLTSMNEHMNLCMNQ